MEYLIIETKNGTKFKVNDKGYISEYHNTDFSSKWKFYGIKNLYNNRIIEFKDLKKNKLSKLNEVLNRANYIIIDVKRGIKREWGEFHTHGLKNITYKSFKSKNTHVPDNPSINESSVRVLLRYAGLE